MWSKKENDGRAFSRKPRRLLTEAMSVPSSSSRTSWGPENANTKQPRSCAQLHQDSFSHASINMQEHYGAAV